MFFLIGRLLSEKGADINLASTVRGRASNGTGHEQTHTGWPGCLSWYMGG